MYYHEFAFYCPDAHSITPTQRTYAISDEALIQRLIHVLRIQLHQNIILFTGTKSFSCTIQTVQKKTITVGIISQSITQPLTPHIHWFVPIIAKEHFEEAIYTLTALGATSITPLLTEKVKRTYNHSREKERLERIMIAAMEQAKQFAFPLLQTPATLEQALASHAMHIVFDAQGKPLFEAITDIQKNNIQSMCCIVGPEGDFSEKEKIMLAQSKAYISALTPTILRAEHAITVAMGCLRSLI